MTTLSYQVKPELLALLKFVLVTLAGGAIGFIAAFTWNAFVVFALLTALVQFLLGIAMNHYRTVKHEEYAFQQRFDEQAILAANSVEVDCSACKTRHSIPIIVSQRNLFKCRKCEVENTIIVTAETALTTKTE